MSSKRPEKITAWCSKWSVPGLLARLSGYRRVDQGREALAFRVVGDSPMRSVYVYLYGDDPDAIHFDLEDTTEQLPGLEQPPEHGSVWSDGDLALVVRWWLREPVQLA